MRLIAVGRLRPGPEADLCARYLARLRPKTTVTELAEGSGSPAEMKRREAVAMLACLPVSSFVVALDSGGRTVSSEDLARHLDSWLGQGRDLAFLIGGAEGLDQAVIERADHVLSFGALTWPHMLLRAMLLEQLYRARCITGGHPYHRAGRPDGQAASRR